MILKSGPHLELHLPSKSIQPQLEGDILTSSNLPSLHYCLCWRSSILTTPFMQWYGNCLSCICSQESLIFPVPTHRELCFTTEPAWGFPGLCSLLPQSCWVPLRLTTTLCLKFSSLPHGGHPSAEHSSPHSWKGNDVVEKERRKLVQSWGELASSCSLSASV